MVHRGVPLWGVDECVCWVRRSRWGLWKPVLQIMALLSGDSYLPPPTLPDNIQCVTKSLCKTFTKKLYQFNIQCVTKVFVQYQFNIQCVTKVFVQDIHKKISPQKWYILNLKIKTSLVLYYKAGRYASQQLFLMNQYSFVTWTSDAGL